MTNLKELEQKYLELGKEIEALKKQNIEKEESTFYTKKCKCMIFEANCFTGLCKNCGGIPKEETKPKTMLESLQEYFKNTSKEKVLEDWNEFQHLDEEGITVKEFLENQKQETLEEAKFNNLIKLFGKGFDLEPRYVIESCNDSFIAGAKWQMNKQVSSANCKRLFSKPIIQYDKLMNIIYEYESLSEAARQTKINAQNISSVCLGKNKSAGGYIWKYKQ